MLVCCCHYIPLKVLSHFVRNKLQYCMKGCLEYLTVCFSHRKERAPGFKADRGEVFAEEKVYSRPTRHKRDVHILCPALHPPVLQDRPQAGPCLHQSARPRGTVTAGDTARALGELLRGWNGWNGILRVARGHKHLCTHCATVLWDYPFCNYSSGQIPVFGSIFSWVRTVCSAQVVLFKIPAH